jgi:glycosyltransferase involved in cell wall biosynthesis
LRKRGARALVKTIGGEINLTNLKTGDPFIPWIEEAAKNFEKNHSRKNLITKIWHINGSLESFSSDQDLFTFYELDDPTRTEVNILKNQRRVFVTSRYTKEVFEAAGLNNVVYAPLGFDHDNFYKKQVRRPSAEVVFGLAGKLEKRKAHHKVIQAWIKKYGNNPKYLLNCAIQNPFIDPNQQSQAILQIMGGKRYYNVNFLGFMQTNEVYNEFLNANDIIIGMSHAEGFGLPEFHSVALGKHGVILNAHAYKDWAKDSGVVLVNPSGKIDSEDGVFFKKGGDFNQGRYFDWEEDEFIAACEKAEELFRKNPINELGICLPESFNYKKTLDIVLS